MSGRPGRRFPVWLAALSTAVLLGACSNVKPKPTPLEPLTPKIAGRQEAPAVWAWA